jgi:hypothetical protein
VALTDIILVGTPVRSVPPWMWYDSNTTLCINTSALALVRNQRKSVDSIADILLEKTNEWVFV